MQKILIKTSMKDNWVERKLSPADVDAAIPPQQDVGDVPATTQQSMLDVSARRRGASVLRRRSISGEANLEVVQHSAGHKALQLLSGNTSGEFLGRLQTRAIFPARSPLLSQRGRFYGGQPQGEMMESEWM